MKSRAKANEKMMSMEGGSAFGRLSLIMLSMDYWLWPWTSFWALGFAHVNFLPLLGYIQTLWPKLAISEIFVTFL